MADGRPWPVRVLDGTVAELIAAEPAESPAAELWWCRPTDRALVLGSSQSPPAGWVAPPGSGVVRRRSGGSAVAIVPEEMVWVEAIVPAGSAWWSADVGRQMTWFGDIWHRAIAAVDPRLAAMVDLVDMPRPPSDASRLVCFAGHGRGELVGSSAVKLVGISQRRTGRWARLQSMVHRRWPADDYRELLRHGGVDASLGAKWAMTIPSTLDTAALVDALAVAAGAS